MRTAELSPFIPTLEQQVRDALRGLLELPDDWAVDLTLGADEQAPELRVRIDVEAQAELRLALSGLLGADAEGEAANRLGVRFERPATRAGTALLARARRALTRGGPERDAGLSRLQQALQEWARYRHNRDEDYRRIAPSPDGPYGTLRLGYRCNQKCHFCWQGRDWPGAPLERYESWLDEMAGAGVRDLNITGGEPTVFAELLPLLARARDHGMRVSIQSNAIRLAQPDFARRLFELGLVAVMVSYHSADPELSDQMTAAPGTHARTVQGIRAALAAGIKVSLTCVVEQANVHGLEQHARDVVQRFVEPFPDNRLHRVAYAHPTSYYEEAAWRRCQIDFDAIRPHLVAACRVLHAARVPVQVIGSCGFPTCVLRGEPALIEAQMIQRQMFEPEQLEHRRYAPVCAECSSRSTCFGLRQEYLDAFGDRGLEPFRDAVPELVVGERHDA